MAKRNPLAFLADDPDFIPIQALETVTQDVKANGKPEFKYSKADIFRKRQIQKRDLPTVANTIQDAVLFSMTKHGFLHPPYVAELLDITEDEATQRLLDAKLAFLDPFAGTLDVADNYLSGNVGRKLAQAIEAAKSDPRFRANVEALQEVQPPWQSIDRLHPNLRASWVPSEVIQSFAEHALGMVVVNV
jgi:N12 class adenine-specific DNA methylase